MRWAGLMRLDGLMKRMDSDVELFYPAALAFRRNRESRSAHRARGNTAGV